MTEGTKGITRLEDPVVAGRGRGPALRRLLRTEPADSQLDSSGNGRSRSSAAAPALPWIHVDDAASATVLAVEQKATGIYNIVDDDPAPVSEWLPYLAAASERDRRGGCRPGRAAAGRRDGGRHDDRGPWVLQRQGQAGAGLGPALPVVAAGLPGRSDVTRSDEFAPLRPLLFAIAYRILGSVSDAEDAVQETWVRYESSSTVPRSVKAYLSAVVTRVSLDVLRSARVRRETYVGEWFPSHCSTTRMRTPSGRRSWPTRCRWPRSCCSSG